MLTFFVKRERKVQHVEVSYWNKVQILTVVSSSPWLWFALGKGDRPLFLIRNQCVPVKNYWADVQLCFVRVR